MKVSVLDELFLGDWKPPINAKGRNEDKIAKRISTLYEKMDKGFSEEQSKLLEALDYEKMQLEGEEERKCFKVGVRLGFLFALEACGMDLKNL